MAAHIVNNKSVLLLQSRTGCQLLLLLLRPLPIQALYSLLLVQDVPCQNVRLRVHARARPSHVMLFLTYIAQSGSNPNLLMCTKFIQEKIWFSVYLLIRFVSPLVTICRVWIRF